MGDYEACGRIAQLVDLVVARDEELAKLPPPPVDPIVAANALDVAAQPASEGGANA